MYLITWALVHESFFNFFSFQDVTIILVFKQISEFPCDWAEYSNQHVNVIATHSERYPSVLWQASYRIWINLIISIVLTIISIKNNCGEWWNRVISTKFSSCSFFFTIPAAALWNIMKWVYRVIYILRKECPWKGSFRGRETLLWIFAQFRGLLLN